MTLVQTESDDKHLCLGYIVIMGSYFMVDSIFLMMCESQYTAFFFRKFKHLIRLQFKQVFRLEPNEQKASVQQQQMVITFSKF